MIDVLIVYYTIYIVPPKVQRVYHEFLIKMIAILMA